MPSSESNFGIITIKIKTKYKTVVAREVFAKLFSKIDKEFHMLKS